jgi:acetyl esterase
VCSTPTRGDAATHSSTDEDGGVVATLATYGFEHEPVDLAEDVPVPGPDGRDVAVRLYRPEVAGPAPVVAWAHGGFWTQLTVEVLDGYFRRIANGSGCAIAAVDFRMPPEARFPEPVEELHATGTWLRSHGSAYGLDTERIGIAGDCTGGGLAAAATLLDRERREVGYVHQSLIVPLLDARLSSGSWNRLGTGYMVARADVERELERYAPGVSATNPLLSPLCAEDFTGLPPALIVIGDHDPLRDDGERYARALSLAGVDVQLVPVPGLLHHAVVVPRLIQLGRTVMDHTAERIGTAMRAPGAPLAA